MPFWSKKEKIALPVNIHDANPEAVRAKSHQWLEEIQSIRLAGWEADQEGPGAEPRFYVAAERLAKEVGKNRDEFLDEYVQRLRASKYPTSDCLKPDEVQKFAEQGTLDEPHEERRSKCDACAALLSAVRLEQPALAALAEDVRQEFARAAAAGSGSGFSAGPRHQSLPILRSTTLLRNLQQLIPIRVAVAASAVLVLLAAVVTLRNKRGGLTSDLPVQSLALMPIRDVSMKTDDQYIAYGMTDGLITELGSVKGLRVIGSNSVMQFDRTNLEPREIARQLNVEGRASCRERV